MDAIATAGAGRRHGSVGLVAAAIAGVLLILTACAGPSQPRPTGSQVRVLGSWEGPEIDAFRAAVLPFEQRTGVSVEVTTTRDLKGALERGFATGDPPDLAGLPGPGYLAELVRGGRLVDLAGVIDTATYRSDTAPAFIDIGTVDGKLSGVFIKATVKGLFWFDPAVAKPGRPESWDDLHHRALTERAG